ncbi:hypothetical protein AKJ38_00655 [candidate division MSBL1 archaeon SCGC-AAA259I14]|uniref:MoaD family protein n=1 Tax=candidate division MSBL1 archaeon SCGC-AAA259I14 TaxID=1698268 RepID=A0A133UU58_9EURY|nr:hypothetical protein AKJ38_00655 [candidate division MSBL1 archaeon SCGC-AAA259I14]
MKIKVKFFANFRDILGRGEVTVSANNVRELLKYLRDDNEKLKEELFDDAENLELNNFVNVVVNGQRIEVLEGLDTELREGDTVSIFPPVAGGRRNQ